MAKEGKTTTASTAHPEYLKYVSPAKADELCDGIVRLLLVGKRYKDMHYTAKQLAEDLQTNQRYLSVVFHTRLHTNYCSYVNKLRVDKAMSILTDRRYAELRMQDVADMVGFSNRQSFYNAFQKQVGIKPLDYRRQNKTW